MSQPSCGLDFGTSNSTIGLSHAGRAQLVLLEDGKPTLPSAIFFNFEDNTTLFGRQAIQAYTEGTQGRLMRALKSVLGSNLSHESTQIKHRQIPFTQVIGSFIAHLKQQAERTAQTPLTHVVIGRPVHFVDDNPAADAAAQHQLEAIARTQGFQHIAFQYEPIAAALDYEQHITTEQLALIVDLGGGTADFSIVRVSPERAQHANRSADILANAGVHIGGTDFDRLFSLAEVMPALGKGSTTLPKGLEVPATYYHTLATWHRINTLYHPQTLQEIRSLLLEATQPHLLNRLLHILTHRRGHALAGLVEQAKINLSTQPSTLLDLPLPAPGTTLSLNQRALNQSLAPAVERIVHTVAHTLHQAQLSATAIQAVFLTGGSSQIPLVQQSILQLFPTARVVHGDTFGSVGLGLTLHAQRIFA